MGADSMRGGQGADIFKFAVLDGSVDTIEDFEASEGDAFDIADVLGSYDPLVDNITDFIKIEYTGSQHQLFVDIDGGAYNFTHIANIIGSGDLTDEAQLLRNGNLLV